MHFCLSICHCYCFTLASKPRQWYICLSKLVIFNKLCLKYIIHKHYVCLQMNLVSILLNSLNIFKSCTAIKTVISYVLRSCGCIASDKIRKKRQSTFKHATPNYFIWRAMMTWWQTTSYSISIRQYKYFIDTMHNYSSALS